MFRTSKWNWPFSSDIAESGALAVINMVKGNREVLSDIGVVLADINHRLSIMVGSLISFIYRECNKAAHMTAKWALAD